MTNERKQWLMEMAVEWCAQKGVVAPCCIFENAAEKDCNSGKPAWFVWEAASAFCDGAMNFAPCSMTPTGWEAYNSGKNL